MSFNRLLISIKSMYIFKYFCSYQGHVLVDETEDSLQFVELDAVVVGNVP